MNLYYVLDPMCSWCWGFRPAFQALLAQLPKAAEVTYVMGGLAPDSQRPMPKKTRDYVQQQWNLVNERCGVEFNWNFWTRCQPRRSTYAACRAVIAAGLMDKKMRPKMIYAIQKAYYLQARNPSDTSTLVELADELGLYPRKFEQHLKSPTVEDLLQADFRLRLALDVQHYPSVIVSQHGAKKPLTYGYCDAEQLLQRYSKAVTRS